MLGEYEDMIFLCRRAIDILFYPFQHGLTKYIIEHLFSVFLILCIYTLLFSHMSACVFIFTEKQAEYGQSDQSPVDRYISVLYFMVTTSATVGYGDITIDHKSVNLVFGRYLYQVLLMLLTLVLNSAFYSLINSSVNDAIYMFEKMQEPLEEFDYWQAARIRKMEKSTNVNNFYKQNNTNFNFLYNFGLEIWIWYLDFIEKIPVAWRNIIIENVCSDLRSKFINYFDIQSKELTHEQIFAMKPSTMLKGDVIVQRREPFPGIFFIIDGEVRVFFRSKANTVYFKSNGDYFGESCLLNRNSHFSYVCETDVLAMFIPTDKLDEILLNYLDERHNLERRAAMRERKLKNMKFRIQLKRSQLTEIKRRQVVNLEYGLPNQQDLLNLQSGRRKKDKSRSSSSSSSSSSSGNSDKKKKGKNAQAMMQPSTSLKKAGKLKPGIPRVLPNVASKELKEPEKVSLNQVAPIVHPQPIEIEETIFVDRKLNMEEVIDHEMEREKRREVKANEEAISHGLKVIKIFLISPLKRLHAALQSSSVTGKTKLLRSNSIDFRAQEEVQRKMDVVMKVLSASPPNDTKQGGFSAHRATRPQLQKELILASSKTMARERVRDFALSLHKSPLKGEFIARPRKPSKANQKGAVGLQRILAPLLKEVAMDGSLAESTVEENIQVG